MAEMYRGDSGSMRQHFGIFFGTCPFCSCWFVEFGETEMMDDVRRSSYNGFKTSATTSFEDYLILVSFHGFSTFSQIF